MKAKECSTIGLSLKRIHTDKAKPQMKKKLLENNISSLLYKYYMFKGDATNASILTVLNYGLFLHKNILLRAAASPCNKLQFF